MVRGICMPRLYAIYLVWKKIMERIIIGTRASQLAMTQTYQAIALLRRQWPDLETVITQIHTSGDRQTNVPLTQIGGDGIFVTEIEHALREGRIDLAVHSLKDLPTAQPDGLYLMTAGEREDVRDVFVFQQSAASSAFGDGLSDVQCTALL